MNSDEDISDVKLVPRDKRLPRIPVHNFRNEWEKQGYPIPEGGWRKYQIHLIKPLVFGGTYEFWNLVPVEKGFQIGDFHSFWRYWEVNENRN